MIPFAYDEIRQVQSDAVQPMQSPLAMAACRGGVSALGSAQRLGDRLGQRPGTSPPANPQRDQDRCRRTHLAERQVRVFPPDGPDGTRPGTDS